MRGIDGAARIVAGSVSAHVADRLGLLAAELGAVPPNGIDVTPRLVHWAQLEPAAVAVEHWPFVMVVPVRTVEFRYADRKPDGAVAWDVRYQLQVFGYVRGEGYDEVAAARGRLGLALREVLFAYPNPAAGVRVEWQSVSEDYSAVGAHDGGTVAAVLLPVVVKVAEALAPAVEGYGEVLSTSVDVRAGDPSVAVVPAGRAVGLPDSGTGASSLVPE